MVFAELDEEYIPELLKGRPRCAQCLAFTIGTLTIVITSITIGILIGYTFCYVEHRNKMNSGKSTNTSALVKDSEIVNVTKLPQAINKTTNNKNKTLHGALINNVILSKIIDYSQKLVRDKFTFLPWPNPVNAFLAPKTIAL